MSNPEFGIAAWLVGQQRQRPRDTPGLWDSLETPGEVAKLAPRGERLTGDAGSGVHHFCDDGSWV
jgi:hypothetical protein